MLEQYKQSDDGHRHHCCRAGGEEALQNTAEMTNAIALRVGMTASLSHMLLWCPRLHPVSGSRGMWEGMNGTIC